MKDTIKLAIEASKQLCQALEDGEVQAASSLVSIRDRLIRNVPVSNQNDDAIGDIDVDFEALIHQLQELDGKIQLLANGLLTESKAPEKMTVNTNANQQKLKKRYKS